MLIRTKHSNIEFLAPEEDEEEEEQQQQQQQQQQQGGVGKEEEEEAVYIFLVFLSLLSFSVTSLQ